MPYDIVRNGPGCKGGYAVVGPSGAHGCHKTRGSAIGQQRALYAAEANSKKVVKAEDWEGKPLYDQLSDAEQMLADSLLKLAEEAGPLNKADGIWVGYEDGYNNENASIGVKCGNCALHKSSVACAILDIPIEEEGACRFAVIPDGYVTEGNNMDDNMNDNMENSFGEDMSKRSLEDLDLEKAKSVSVGDHVTYGVPKPPAKTQQAHGIVERIVTSGTVTIGQEKVEASSDKPVAVIRVYATKEGGGYMKTDRTVAKPVSSLRVSSESMDDKKMYHEDEEIEKVSLARLQELADKYNKNKEGNKRITVGALRQVYNRGIGAYRTNPGSVRPNVSSAEQWAMGRVNAFMAGLRGNFPRTAFDLDLFPKGHPRHSDKKQEAKKSLFEGFAKDVSKPQRVVNIFSKSETVKKNTTNWSGSIFDLNSLKNNDK